MLYDVQISWESKRQEYVKASAPVSAWNKLLDTDFLYFSDEHPMSRTAEDKLVIRTKRYTMPSELVGHVDTIFNTIQPIPVINKNLQMAEGSPYRKDFRVMGDDQTLDNHQNVTIEYLASYYNIPTNIGDSGADWGQSVFETDEMSFSQADLTAFQNEFSLTVQAALDIGGFDIDQADCSFDTCGEGSLDIQYIMGMSQTTISTYYYVAGDDPFVTWVTDLADDCKRISFVVYVVHCIISL
jgi:hypothetical protein